MLVKAITWLRFIFFVTLCFLGRSAVAQDEHDLRFIPQWVPQAQFAGYYVAYEKGFYDQAGVRVQILRGGPGHSPSLLLKDGRADCGSFFLADALQRVNDGLPIVHLAQLGQQSSYMLVARKGSGIYKPSDLGGRKVSLWGGDFQVQPNAFFAQHNIQVEVIPQSQTVNAFLRGAVDAASAMWHNEYNAIINSGVEASELSTFFFHEYGLNFPEDGIYCRGELFETKPGKVCSFVEATLRGWQYAFEHKEETLDIVMRYVQESNGATNRVHQQWMLERMQDIFLPKDMQRSLGSFVSEDMDRVQEHLRKARLIEQDLPFSSFHRECP